jgi:hypothetical protein
MPAILDGQEIPGTDWQSVPPTFLLDRKLSMMCRLPFWTVLTLAGTCLAGVTVFSQEIPGGPSDLWRDPVLPKGINFISRRSAGDGSSPCRSCRFPLFRMPAAFPSDLLSLDTEGDLPAETLDRSSSANGDTDWAGDSRVQVAMGAHNPFFDFRRPGDPGGVGYYKLHSKVQLLDGGAAGLSMGFQAVTPAGLESEGLPDGPTVLSPNMAWFYEATNGTAIHGFVGKNLRARAGWADNWERNIHYGLAVQSPLPVLDNGPNRGLHLFVEALGRYRIEGDPSQRTSATWELLPGLHWHLRETMWMSGGILVPLGPARLDSRLWQITCSWQF